MNKDTASSAGPITGRLSESANTASSRGRTTPEATAAAGCESRRVVAADLMPILGPAMSRAATVTSSTFNDAGNVTSTAPGQVIGHALRSDRGDAR